MITLETFRLKNFKAIRDSGPQKFGPFTLLVGGNGSGKSSLLEGLEVFHSLGTADVDAIFNQSRWRGFHHVWNKAAPHRFGPKKDSPRLCSNPMTFEARINRLPARPYEICTMITQSDEEDVVICAETVTRGSDRYERDSKGKVRRTDSGAIGLRTLEPGVSILSMGFTRPFKAWQFLNLQAAGMGQPTSRLGGKISNLLSSDGSNLAEVLRRLSQDGINRLIESLQQVLLYAKDLQIEQFSSVDRTVYLKIKEGDFDVPGWLLSSGTVRLVAILACLYHDVPPPLLVIDELENGLDPRTVAFLINQIRDAVKSRRIQVIATTHSPHLLSQVSIEHLLLCQRGESGEPMFWRPADSDDLRKWSEDFDPGNLYATGRIQKAMTKALRRK